MYKNKRIGFLLPPFPKAGLHFLKKQNIIDNSNSKYIFSTPMVWSTLVRDSIKKKMIENNIELVILKYNLKSDTLNKILTTLDGIFITGNYGGNSWYRENNIDYIDHLKHFNFVKKIYKKVITINETIRPFFLVGICYGQELIIKIMENLKYHDNRIIKNVNKKKNSVFLQNPIYFDKKYYMKGKHEYNLRMGTFLSDFKKTKNLKKDFNIVSIYKLHNRNIVDIIKHKKYPIFFSKSSSLVENNNIIKELFETVEISNFYRKNFTSKVITIPKISYNIKKIHKNQLMNDEWPWPNETWGIEIIKL